MGFSKEHNFICVQWWVVGERFVCVPIEGKKPCTIESADDEDNDYHTQKRSEKSGAGRIGTNKNHEKLHHGRKSKWEPDRSETKRYVPENSIR